MKQKLIKQIISDITPVHPPTYENFFPCIQENGIIKLQIVMVPGNIS